MKLKFKNVLKFRKKNKKPQHSNVSILKWSNK